MSTFSGFYKLSVKERLEKIKEFANLSDGECKLLEKQAALGLEQADRMIENVIGTTQLPLGVATNFIIDGKEKLIPMSIEEPSVVAGASKAAKLALPDGFKTKVDESIMIGQIQMLNVKDTEKAMKEIEKSKKNILDLANEQDKVLTKFGGGARDVETHKIDTERGQMIIVHLLVDVRDAMGANAVNTMCEAIAPLLESITKGEARLRIISNLATYRLAHAEAVWKKETLGPETIEHILDAYHFAENDQYRCTTHNKGVMNGIDALMIATGNDFRAIEAGAHSYASTNGYRPLTTYEKTEKGNLKGFITVPMAVGIVGGATRTHPIAQICMKILKIKTAQELARIAAALGLAQNFAALLALSTEGIQRGHLKLHAANFAVMAGASGDIIDKIVEKMIEEGNISYEKASELLKKFQRLSDSKATSET